jgi:beta-lactamase regulating signal transducer with metallopeptidase domain
MERLFLECAVRAALLVAGTAIVLSVMRVKAAAAKHSVWAAMVLLMLVLPVWAAWGPKASLRLLPSSAQMNANSVIVPAVALSTTFQPSRLISIWPAVLLAVYLLGVCFLLFRLAIGTIRARRMVRTAVTRCGVHTSALCAAPVTVGFFHPVVIFPEHWPQWSQKQLDVVLTHEGEHARRRDSLVQWLALLNRALWWFHPAAWWLEHQLSALAEEACDNVVLARFHNPREYSECLIEMARSVMRSGARLNSVGMAMPGSSLHRRIRQILEWRSAPQISGMRMACVGVSCAITCTAFAIVTLDRAQKDFSPQSTSAAHPVPKFILGDIKIEGEVHDRSKIRDRILKAWAERDYGDDKELTNAVAEGIRADFQERGYFKVVVQGPVSRPLELVDGKQPELITAAIVEGDQFRLGALTIQNVPANRTLSIPTATLLDQFHIRTGDLFNMLEIRAGLDRLNELYGTRGFAEVEAAPDTKIDSPSHRIDLTLRITEGPHKP